MALAHRAQESLGHSVNPSNPLIGDSAICRVLDNGVSDLYVTDATPAIATETPMCCCPNVVVFVARSESVSNLVCDRVHDFLITEDTEHKAGEFNGALVVLADTGPATVVVPTDAPTCLGQTVRVQKVLCFAVCFDEVHTEKSTRPTP